MLSPITRIADFGRNYALLGAFGACLAGAWSLPLDGPTATVDEAATPLDEAMASDSWQMADVRLVSDDATPPRLEVAIAELPMPELPPFDWSALERGEPAPPGEARPMHGRFSHALTPLRRQVTTMRVASASELTQAFEAHDYTLDRARRGGHVPALEIDRVPADLVQVRDGNERKELFIKALLPMVLEANERVLAERTHLKRLRDRHGAGRGLSVIERMWLAEVADRYGAPSAEFDELLQRVDIVPPSMAIAQAGVESGWGTSYAARVGNALFGQIQVTGRHSVAVPWQPGRAMPQPFGSVAESVEAYVMNLNTHFAYADFRVERARLRAEGKEPDGYHLMGQLRRYSELGQGYINFVRNVIRENRLSDFDGAKLPPI
ncbi:MAG TPA: glucosaminidase domain-containing protein [Vineibacter sp.]|nr:glucosaminidase domain-containing protein [Vineibacter sp.]